MSRFSNRLISLRKEQKMTQSDLAKLLGKQRSTVSGYETDGKEPDFDTLCTLADHFEVSVDTSWAGTTSAATQTWCSATTTPISSGTTTPCRQI